MTKFKRLYFDIPKYYQLVIEESEDKFEAYVLSFSKYGKTSERKLTIYLNYDGYPAVKMNNKTVLLHRLIAEYTVPKIEGKDFINHIDGNKLNYHYSNLEWCTLAENTKHSYKTGLHVSHNPQNHGKYIDGRCSDKVKYKRDWYLKNRERILIKTKERYEKSKV